jgi:hypothetical protein
VQQNYQHHPKNYPEINDVKPSVKTNLVPNYDIEINTKTNYDGDGFCGFISKNYPEINDVKPSNRDDWQNPIFAQWVISLNLALARLRLEG